VTSYLVTTTPPTPNGDLHVGHLSGPFLAADVFCRYQRSRGRRVVFATGSDDHQTYVLTAALKQGRDPAELAGAYADEIEATLAAAEVRVDSFARSLGDPAHRRLTQELFRELIDRGLVERRRYRALCCTSCERLLFEGFLQGRCPRCGADTPGHLCEMCGRVGAAADLVEPYCALCKGAPAETEREAFFFPLEPHRWRLEEFWATRTGWRPHLRAYCEEMLAEPLPDYQVSYPGSWGVPVPSGEPEVVNVWLEMYAGHVLAARTAGVATGEETDFTLVQFLGHDNSFYNAVLHTAVALALGGSWPLPEHLVTNEFYFLEDKKFSTSRNHMISARHALKALGPDNLRFHLARTNPERWQSNFSLAAANETRQREIQNIWAPAIEGLKHLALQAPVGGSTDLRILGLVEGARADLERHYDAETFSLRQASNTLLGLATAAADLARRESNSPQPGRSTDATTLLRALAEFAAPLMPQRCSC